MNDYNRTDKRFPGNEEEIQKHLRKIFEFLGERPDREGLKETPSRMMKSWYRIFGGYLQNPEDTLTFFKEDNVVPKGQIILLRDVELYSTCEHHFLPFVGKAHVAYIPKKKVVGISKLARLLEVYSRRLQIQERICNQVVEAVMKHLDAEAAACIIESKHFCMCVRGVEKQNSTMVTSALEGGFLTNSDSRKELMHLIGMGNRS